MFRPRRPPPPPRLFKKNRRRKGSRTRMSTSSPEPRSIAAQLILLLTLAAALLLACGLGVFYWIVVRHAFAEDNAVLADKVSALAADLKESGSARVAEELKTHRADEHAAYWIRMLDS